MNGTVKYMDMQTIILIINNINYILLLIKLILEGCSPSYYLVYLSFMWILMTIFINPRCVDLIYGL